MDRVRAWLERSRELGFLGPGPVDHHITHAAGFASAFPTVPRRVLDLGSGGGLPGLILAERWSQASFVLLDSNERRTAFLAQASTELGWDRRVRVVRARAEVAGRDETLRGCFDAVVSRSFGPPPVAAECAAPFLELGGRFVVSEPPGEIARWPEESLGELGFHVERRYTAEAGFVALLQATLCPDRYPRREGIPAKRPLW